MDPYWQWAEQQALRYLRARPWRIPELSPEENISTLLAQCQDDLPLVAGLELWQQLEQRQGSQTSNQSTDNHRQLSAIQGGIPVPRP
jgi:hypothetical protein